MTRSRRSAPARVFLHIGLPKTGTTYLQQVLWSNRKQLVAGGIFLPGFGHREHLWAALDLRERPRLAKRDPRAPGSWRRLVDEAGTQGRDVLITHEFFCGASPGQAQRAIAAFPDSEVHLLVTARDAAGIALAGWQESVKNGGRTDLEAVLDGARASGPEFSMRNWDLVGVLERWTEGMPPERVHVLPMPGPGQPRDLHWRHFAGVLGVDPDDFEAPAAAANPALGITQIELLRRVNEHLPNYSALERGTWIRGYLAEDLLARQEGVRARMPDERRAAFLERDRRAIELIQARGFDVVGDLARLQGREPGPHDRLPTDVSADEIVESAARLVAAIVADVRASTGDVPPRPRGNQSDSAAPRRGE